MTYGTNMYYKICDMVWLGCMTVLHISLGSHLVTPSEAPHPETQTAVNPSPKSPPNQ